MAKRKQSKAEREYTRLRRNLLQQRSRKQKQGYNYHFDLPATPKQELWGERNPTAKDYREAIKELEQLKTRVENRFSEMPKPIQELPDVSDIVIENFTKGLEQGKGGAIIVEAVERMKNAYGSEEVAKTIEQMKQDDITVRAEVFYEPQYAIQFVSQMMDYLRRNSFLSDMETMEMEDEIQVDIESFIPEELQ